MYSGNFDLERDILNNANIGLWAIELDENAKPRMFADRAMMRLLGISAEMTPEEVYDVWYNNIDTDCYPAVQAAVEKMTAGIHAEVQYPWFHPTKGLTYVRCGGVRNYNYKFGVRLEGCHQNITDMIHIQNNVELTRSILANENIGLWAIEIDEGAEPRMHADETMLKLLGIDTKLTPEQVYHAWYDYIDPDHYDEIQDAVNKMTNGSHAEVQYPWQHPGKGLTYVRCGGIRNMAYKRGIRLEGCHQDITTLIHIQKQVEEMQDQLMAANIRANTDAMTGVLNHSGFILEAEKLLTANKEKKANTYIIFIDMDNLKKINDTYGHDDGDYCIRTIASTLSHIISNRGFVGRLGGDEFGCIVTCRGAEKSGKYFDDRIRKAFEKINETSGKPYPVSISLGGRFIEPDDEITIDAALDMADTKMYVEKKMKKTAR